MEQINKYNFSFFGGYILVTILVVGLYFLWSENDILKKNIVSLNKNLQDIQQENLSLHKKLIELQEKLQSSKSFKASLDKETQIIKKAVQKQTTQAKQKILIVLPEEEKQYHQIVPKIEYKNIDLKDDNNTAKEKNRDDLKISPELFIDKDEKKLNGARIEIETKF